MLEYETAKGPATLRGFEEYENETRNRVELRTLIAACSRLREKGLHLTIYTDSVYVSAAIEQGWVQQWKDQGWKIACGEPVKNAAEWEELESLLAGQEISVKKRQSHPYRDWLEWEISKKCHERK